MKIHYNLWTGMAGSAVETSPFLDKCRTTCVRLTWRELSLWYLQIPTMMPTAIIRQVFIMKKKILLGVGILSFDIFLTIAYTYTGWAVRSICSDTYTVPSEIIGTARPIKLFLLYCRLKTFEYEIKRWTWENSLEVQLLFTGMYM